MTEQAVKYAAEAFEIESADIKSGWDNMDKQAFARAVEVLANAPRIADRKSVV